MGARWWNLFGQARRMLVRDWRAGELQLLTAALVVAVAAMTSVGFLVARFESGFERDAARLLGGDLVISADQPLGASLREQARAQKLRTTQTATFPSMAMQTQAPSGSDPIAQLVSVKAVDDGYPLRGVMRIAEQRGTTDHPAGGIPARGTVWVDESLLAALGVMPGGELRLGDRRFRIAALVTLEEDRGTGFASLAPRVMMRLDDLDSTGLLQPGARVGYRLMVAGDASAVSNYRLWIEPRLGRGQHLETVLGRSDADTRPQAQQTVGRAQSFMSLVALLTVMLAAVAIALAARRFVQRHIDACAVLRCLGSSAGRITGMFAIEFIALGLAASLVGALIGWVGHFVLLGWLARYAGVELPSASPWPAVRGVATGMVLLIGFALPPLLQLRHVPPLRVLRRELGPPQVSVLGTYGLGIGAFAALLLWFADDAVLAMAVGAGFLCVLLIDALVVYAALRLLGRWREYLARRSVVLRFALAGVARNPGATLVPVVAVAVGLMALLLLTLVRSDLIDAWRGTAGPDAPNRFVLNLQPEQRDAFNAALVQAGMPAQRLYPMVRGRLAAINDQPIAPESFDARARRLIDREFNLSYMDDAPAHNRIIEGRWFAPDAQEISVESGLMKTLGLKLGDLLRFDVAGTQVQGRITSVREVQWNSMRVNFFVIFPSAQLAAKEQSYITSFRMPPEQDIGPRLLSEFPNLTIVDTGAMLNQILQIIDQVASAVEFLFAFAVAAGVLVLLSALSATRDERLHESALLRALGAGAGQLRAARYAEFGVLGLLAGLLAAAGAVLAGLAIAHVALDFTLKPGLAVFLVGAGAGMTLFLLGAWLGLRQVLTQTPLASLRQA